MKAHQTTIGKNDTWFTPPEIIAALGGWESFDLDPANVPPPYQPKNLKTAKASCWVGESEDGLSFEWYGRIWLNPPFNRRVRHLWMKKMAEHNNGIMLIPAACETDAFYKYVWPKATAILFLKGRPHFHYVDGTRAKANSGCTICLVAYGEYNAVALEKSGLGQIVRW